MEYSFCATSWDCWYAWLWSSPTAAWVQAAATILLLVVTWSAWTHDRRCGEEADDREKRERHQADMLNLEKIIQYMAACAHLTEQLLDEGIKHRALSVAKVQANQTQLRRAAGELSWFVRHDRSHHQVTSTVMGFHVTCLQLSQAFDAVLAKLNRQAADEIAAYTAKVGIDDGFTNNLRDAKEQMEGGSKLIATYCRRFSEDRNADFPTTADPEEGPEEV